MSLAHQIVPLTEQHSVAAINVNSLQGLVDRAAKQLASAKGAAEVLDAAQMASVAYDAAKKAARFAKAKGAADELISKAHRAQADALEIEAAAKRQLADEYDAAQERGEVQRHGGQGRRDIPEQNIPSVGDIGLTAKDIHEARQIRDAEVAQPGIARRALDARLAQGLEPNKAALREAVTEAAKQGLRGNFQAPSNRNPNYVAPTKAGAAWTHLYGTCRAIAEWATDENMALAIQGLVERKDDQTANVRAVRRAAAIISEISEKLNAH